MSHDLLGLTFIGLIPEMLGSEKGCRSTAFSLPLILRWFLFTTLGGLTSSLVCGFSSRRFGQSISCAACDLVGEVGEQETFSPTSVSEGSGSYASSPSVHFSTANLLPVPVHAPDAS